MMWLIWSSLVWLKPANLLIAAGILVLCAAMASAQDLLLDAPTIKAALESLTDQVLDNCVYEGTLTYGMTASFQKGAHRETTFKFARSGEDLLVEVDAVTQALPKGQLWYQTAILEGKIPVRIELKSGKSTQVVNIAAFPRTSPKDYLALVMESSGVDYLLGSFHRTEVSLPTLREDPRNLVLKDDQAILTTEYGELHLAFAGRNQFLMVDSISLVQGPGDRFGASSRELLRDITSDQRTLPGSKDGLTGSTITQRISYEGEGNTSRLSRLQTKWKLDNANGHIELLSDLRVTRYRKLSGPAELQKMMVSIPNGTPVRLIGDRNDAQVKAIWKDGAVVRVADGKVIEAITDPISSGSTRVALAIAVLGLGICALALVARRHFRRRAKKSPLKPQCPPGVSS
jgi:hypothetical protein